MTKKKIQHYLPPMRIVHFASRFLTMVRTYCSKHRQKWWPLHCCAPSCQRQVCGEHIWHCHGDRMRANRRSTCPWHAKHGRKKVTGDNTEIPRWSPGRTGYPPTAGELAVRWLDFWRLGQTPPKSSTWTASVSSSGLGMWVYTFVHPKHQLSPTFLSFLLRSPHYLVNCSRERAPFSSRVTKTY